MNVVDRYKMKLTVLGDPSVGKTSLIHHFCEGYFRDSYLSTIGVEFLTKEVDVSIDGEEKNAILQIWDVGGQDLFSKLRSSYLKGAQGALILFDVTNKSTLLHIDSWIEEVLRSLDLSSVTDLPFIVIGNKIDLDFDQRLKKKADNFMKNQFESQIPIHYTSAKTGTGMNEVFEKITKLMIKELDER
ncbi:MAG: Rab family GTPase [Promethearchaeia archaeon]